MCSRVSTEVTGSQLEVSVGLKMIMLLAIGIWIAVTFVVISLCRAAKWSDESMENELDREMALSRRAESTDALPADVPLRSLDLDDAAALLGVSPETLLAWEARYGFPTPSPAERLYNEAEVIALRESIRDEVSIAGAVVRARKRIRRRYTSTGPHVADRRDDGLAS